MALSNTPDKLADSLQCCFENTVVSSKFRSVRQFRIATKILEIQCASPEIEIAICSALAHTEIKSKEADADLTVYLFSSDNEYNLHIKFPWILQDFIKLKETASESHPSLIHNDGRFLFHSSSRNNLLFFDQVNNKSYFWVKRVDEISQSEKAAPLRYLFAYYFENTPTSLIHGASVATNEGAIILSGPSGSGKSTTAILCLEAGMTYLSDDYCAIDSTIPPVIFSTYCSAKLLPRSFALTKLVTLEQAVFDDKQSSKGILNIDQNHHSQISPSAPLRAIITCSISSSPTSSIHKTSTAAGLKSLAPSTLFQGGEDKTKTFKKLVTIVKSTPVYSLLVAPDTQRIPELIRDVISESIK